MIPQIYYNPISSAWQCFLWSKCEQLFTGEVEKNADNRYAGMGMRGPEADEDSRRKELHRFGREDRIQREHRPEIHVRLLYQRQPPRGNRAGAWDEVTK